MTRAVVGCTPGDLPHELVQSLSENDRQGGRRAGQVIQQQFLLLETIPDIGRPFPELPELPELRELVDFRLVVLGEPTASAG